MSSTALTVACDEGCLSEPAVAPDLGENEGRDVRARDGAAIETGEVGEGAEDFVICGRPLRCEGELGRGDLSGCGHLSGLSARR